MLATGVSAWRRSPADAAGSRPWGLAVGRDGRLRSGWCLWRAETVQTIGDGLDRRRAQGKMLSYRLAAL